MRQTCEGSGAQDREGDFDLGDRVTTSPCVMHTVCRCCATMASASASGASRNSTSWKSGPTRGIEKLAGRHSNQDSIQYPHTPLRARSLADEPPVRAVEMSCCTTDHQAYVPTTSK